MNRDFLLYGKSCGINSLVMHDYISKGYQNPMILEESKLNAAPIDIFSRLMKNRIIFLGNEITSEVANIIQAQLLYLQATSDSEITIYINSPGGNVIDGLGIYDTMQFVRPKIKTVCTGMAASMASLILVGGEKGERRILPHGRVLIHQPWGVTSGTASDMSIDIAEINKDKDIIFSLIANHTGKTVDEIKKDAERDFWMNANEALAYGCVDKII